MLQALFMTSADEVRRGKAITLNWFQWLDIYQAQKEGEAKHQQKESQDNK